MNRAKLEAWAEPRRARVQALLTSRFEGAWPPQFQEACRYPLGTGGKRIRPLLTLAAVEALGADIGAAALHAAAAVELVHTYSLVHDDLPAMDDDDLRRGRPTVHRAYDEATAILVGDAQLTEAFSTLTDPAVPAALRGPLVAELAHAAGHRGMVGGQAADVGLGGPVADLEALLRLHRGKTGALIRVAVRMGGLAAGATATQLRQLTTYGEDVGLAFQLADDVLDAEEDAGDDGPPNVVKLLGLDETRRRAATLCERALAAISDLPAPASLAALARFTVDREI